MKTYANRFLINKGVLSNDGEFSVPTILVWLEEYAENQNKELVEWVENELYCYEVDGLSDFDEGKLSVYKHLAKALKIN